MKTATIVLEGTRPIMWSALSIEGFGQKRKERGGTAGNDPTEWKKSYRATTEGQLYLTPEQIFGCFREAAKHTKAGKGTITRKVAATFQVDTPRIMVNRFMPQGDPPMNDYEAEVYIDVRQVKNPATRAANIRYRVTANHGWKTEPFQVTWDPTIVSEPEMRQVAIDAGALEGLGSGRTIGMGRFKVISFDVK
jgi:hypothetical protein